VIPATREPSEEPGSSHGAGVALLVLAGSLQLLYGTAAVVGFSGLQESVRDIESNPNYGKLYLPLTGWGILLLLVGAATLLTARLLHRRGLYARMYGLCAALVGLGLAFFTLAIFHEASLISIVVLLVTTYVLSYLVRDPPGSRPPY